MKKRNRLKSLLESHSSTSFAVLATSFLLLLIHALTWEIIPTWSSNLLSNAATALLAVAAMEIIFKGFLQQQLIHDAVQAFKKGIQLPVSAVYLRRTDLPEEQDPVSIVSLANEEIYIKGITFSKLLADGFPGALKDFFRRKSSPKVHFLMLSPDYKALDEVASLTGLESQAIRLNIKTFTTRLNDLIQEGYPVDYSYYNSFPTTGIWLVDPKSINGWARIELYIHHQESQSSRANLVVSNEDDEDFFQRLYDQILSEYNRGVINKNQFNSEPINVICSDERITNRGKESSQNVVVDKINPHFSNVVLAASFPTMNLPEMIDFYLAHDPLVKKGVRGALSMPPRTSDGILRIFEMGKPDKHISLKLGRPTGFVYIPEEEEFIIACQGTNSIVSITPERLTTIYSHPLFNHLHSLDYYNGLLAVSCSGTDSVVVYDHVNKKPYYVWISTRHGYQMTPDGHIRIVDSNIDHRPRLYPTRRQATHVNSVVISRSEDKVIYASLFHQGQIVRIDMKNNKTTISLSGLDHPHGLKSDGNGGYVITQASSGRILQLNEKFVCVNSFYDSNVEWLQDASALTKEVYVYPDTMNSKFKLANMQEQQVIGNIKYEKELKAYQVRILPEGSLEKFKWLKVFDGELS
ncbi:MAG TPA: hypothetical protein PKW95_19590 [bacterium]|nr:hypothetical protein [bacterium]